MSKSKKPVRIARAVMDMAPYKVSNQKPLFMKQSENPLKLDWNESTISPSPKVAEAIVEATTSYDLNWYPDVEARELRQKLSDYTGLETEYISCFGGSDMALEYIVRTYLESGTTVLMSAPTYDNFRVYAQSTGATVIQVTYDNPFEPDVSRLLNSISARTRLVYICNPNNPTGAMFSEKEIRTLLEKALECMFVIDEAYFEFCGETAANLVKSFNNIIVARSFSKAFGLAALRIGYVLSDPENLEYIHRIKVGKNVNLLGQIAAIAALEDEQYTLDYVSEINESKEILNEEMEKLGFEFVITPANFMLVKFSNPAKGIEQLENVGIFIRDRSTVPQLEGFVRISIGTLEQTVRLIEALGNMNDQITGKDSEPAEAIVSRRNLKETVGI